MSTCVPPLGEVTKELAAREPIFHRPEFGTSRADFERMMAGDFWEVGASGRIYSREFVLEMLAERSQVAAEDHWMVTDFACRQLAQEIFLTTYQLEQDGGRLIGDSTCGSRQQLISRVHIGRASGGPWGARRSAPRAAAPHSSVPASGTPRRPDRPMRRGSHRNSRVPYSSSVR